MPTRWRRISAAQALGNIAVDNWANIEAVGCAFGRRRHHLRAAVVLQVSHGHPQLRPRRCRFCTPDSSATAASVRPMTAKEITVVTVPSA